MQKEIKIIKATYVKGYKINFIFNDGISQTVDFEGFLKSSRHPEIRKYLEKVKFKKFKVIDGDLDWNDYDLIFPIIDLYENKIMIDFSEEAA